jgi:hypothetical protein
MSTQKTADDTIKPYQGPPPTADNFAVSHPQLTDAIKKGVNNLDPESQANLNDLMQTMRLSPPKPVTVVNLHPWPLAFGYGVRLLRGITVPACPPGQPFAHSYIRIWRKDWMYNENGSLKFVPILPIQIAGEFVREFSNPENDGGGVLIYEGEHNPDKAGEVETYDTMGRPVTKPIQTFEYDEENNKIPVLGTQPIKRKFVDVLKEAITARNRVYFRKVQTADRDWNLPDGRGKKNIHEKHLLMAEVLFAEGIITELPKWDLSSRLDEGLEEGNCPACASPKRSGAFKCANCNHILDPVEAYRNSAIEYGHLSMEALTSDELDSIEEIRDEREKARSKFMAKRDKANKGKGADKTASAQGEQKD